jgi:hypothetical protein
MKPGISGFEKIETTTFAFLVGDNNSGTRLLFDCGVRTDYWNYSPMVSTMIKDTTPSLRVDKNINEILEGARYALESLGMFP